MLFLFELFGAVTAFPHLFFQHYYPEIVPP